MRILCCKDESDAVCEVKRCHLSFPINDGTYPTYESIIIFDHLPEQRFDAVKLKTRISYRSEDLVKRYRERLR